MASLKVGLQYYIWNNNQFFWYYSPTNFNIFGTNADGNGVVSTVFNDNDNDGLIDTYGFNNNQNIALKLKGYFYPNVSGEWGFVLGDIYQNYPNDDISYLWIGDSALNPTPDNSLGVVDYMDPPGYFYINLEAGQLYPLLFYWGQYGGGFIITLGIIKPGGSVTYDGSPYYRYSTGSPQLQNSDFSNEYFDNMIYSKKKNISKVILKSIDNNVLKVIIILLLIILIIYILYYILKNKLKK